MTWLRTVFNFRFMAAAFSSPVCKMNSYWVLDDLLDELDCGVSDTAGLWLRLASILSSGDEIVNTGRLCDPEDVILLDGED